MNDAAEADMVVAREADTQATLTRSVTEAADCGGGAGTSAHLTKAVTDFDGGGPDTAFSMSMSMSMSMSSCSSL